MRSLISHTALLVFTTIIGVACQEATAPRAGPDATRDILTIPVEGVEQIFIANADGSNPVHLTAGSSPSWSPDGKRIAFSRDGYLYVVDRNGTNLQLLRNGYRPAWSPDGAKLAFTDSSGIAVASVLPGTEATTLVRHDFNASTYKPWDMGVDKATWSPDGQRIAFEHLGDGDLQPAQIFVARLDGPGVELLTNDPWKRGAESDPSWSPDGKKIAHWSYFTGVTATDVSTGINERIYANFPFVAYGAKPEWSPDGEFILFNSFRWALGKPALYVVPANRGVIREIVADAHSGDWSPDGKQIVFVRSARWKEKF